MGKTKPHTHNRKVFYLFCRKDLRSPDGRRVIGKLYCSIYRSPITPKIQRVHIPLSEPLGIHIVERVVQSSPEALTSLVLPILMVLIPLPCHTISFQTFTSAYLLNNTVTDGFAGCWLCVPPGQTHHHLLWPHPLSY